MRLKKILKFSYVHIPERMKYDSNVSRDLFNEMKIHGPSDLIQQEFLLWPLTKAVICSALFRLTALFVYFINLITFLPSESVDFFFIYLF
jgi:hypothetical protein